MISSSRPLAHYTCVHRDVINLLRERSILGFGATAKLLRVALIIAMGRLEDPEKLPQALKSSSAVIRDPKEWVEVGFVASSGLSHRWFFTHRRAGSAHDRAGSGRTRGAAPRQAPIAT
jgi:hypothetical protein